MTVMCDTDRVAQFFGGRVVQIVAGPQRNAYHVHAKALSESESPSLRTLVSEEWSSSGDGIIDWSHTDTGTAERFFTYLYTGRYAVPDPSPLPDADGSVDEEDMTYVVNEDGDELDSQMMGHSTVEKTHIPSPAVVNREQESEPGSPASEMDSIVERRSHETYVRRPLTPIHHYLVHQSFPLESIAAQNKFDGTAFPYVRYSYAQPLMALARLYSFATYHLLPSLRQSALTQFIMYLVRMDCSQEHAVPKLVELVHFIYENTPSEVTFDEPMRNIISQFIAINYKILLHGGLNGLLLQGGDFVLDLVPKLCRKALDYENTCSTCSRLQGQLKSNHDRFKKIQGKIERLESMCEKEPSTSNQASQKRLLRRVRNLCSIDTGY